MQKVGVQKRENGKNNNKEEKSRKMNGGCVGWGRVSWEIEKTLNASS
jgi:hypothetical protein